jgi:hypothetical protein
VNAAENTITDKEAQNALDMEHFNIDENGVRILDKSLTNQNSPRGMIVDVFFKRGKAWCEYDDTDNCKHIEYALSLPIVREIFKQKGWKTT